MIRASYLCCAFYWITRGLLSSKLDQQMRFSLPSIKCSAAPPSFRLLKHCFVALTVLPIWLPHARQQSEAGRSRRNIWWTVAKNDCVNRAWNFRVGMLLKGAITPKQKLMFWVINSEYSLEYFRPKIGNKNDHPWPEKQLVSARKTVYSEKRISGLIPYFVL